MILFKVFMLKAIETIFIFIFTKAIHVHLTNK